MGQADDQQYWMWMMKRRTSPSPSPSPSSSSHFLKSHLEVSLNCLSDEEKAFAEDATRCLSGCIWPPRSYSCSFCSREFRSAQALGGHMNVHRRDRAKLKQSSTRVSSSSNVVEEEHKVDSLGSDSTTKRTLNDVISGSDDDDDDDVETKLSVGLSSVLFQNKRPKVAVLELIKPATASSIEDLDLELRLGVL